MGHRTQDPRRQGPSVGDAWRVGVGGAGGAVVRWGLVAGVGSTATFPWSTLLVNILGCLLVGALLQAPRSVGMLLGIGFAGGLTTFSTFAVEVASLLDRSELGTALAYLATSVFGGVAALLLGRRAVLRW